VGESLFGNMTEVPWCEFPVNESDLEAYQCSGATVLAPAHLLYGSNSRFWVVGCSMLLI